MKPERKLYGKYLKNLVTFKKFKEIGFDYILNPEPRILHIVNDNFLDSHNLHIADLKNFIGLTNIGIIEVHKFKDGIKIPIYDLITAEYLGDYELNKCEHCSWWY